MVVMAQSYLMIHFPRMNIYLQRRPSRKLFAHKIVVLGVPSPKSNLPKLLDTWLNSDFYRSIEGNEDNDKLVHNRK